MGLSLLSSRRSDAGPVDFFEGSGGWTANSARFPRRQVGLLGRHRGTVRPRLSGKLDGDTLKALRELGMDLEHLQPGYSASLWLSAVQLVIQRALTDRPELDAYRYLGERSVLGLEVTMMGRAMAALAKLVGPRRMLLRLPHSIRSADNFSACTVEERGPGCFEVKIQPTMLPPEFWHGVLDAAVTIAGGKQIRVRTLESQPAQELARFEVKWG